MNATKKSFSCGTVYYAVQSGCNVWIGRGNPKVWQFKWKLLSSTFLRLCLLCIGQIEASTCPPQGIPRAFDTFAVPGRREFDCQSLPGGGEFDPHALGVGNLNCNLYLAWRAIMGDVVLEDYRGKDCAFVANWLLGKGLNKLFAVFEVFKC